MGKDVLLSSRAQKDYKKLSPDMKKRVKAALKKLGAGDKHLDIKKLKGTSGREDLYRLRVGNYRITYKSEKIYRTVSDIPTYHFYYKYITDKESKIRISIIY